MNMVGVEVEVAANVFTTGFQSSPLHLHIEMEVDVVWFGGVLRQWGCELFWEVRAAHQRDGNHWSKEFNLVKSTFYAALVWYNDIISSTWYYTAMIANDDYSDYIKILNLLTRFVLELHDLTLVNTNMSYNS